MNDTENLLQELKKRFDPAVLSAQETKDSFPTIWVSKERILDVLRFLKNDLPKPFRMLYDLTAVDERMRTHRDGQPPSDFTVVYQLMSFDRNSDVRIKVPLQGEKPSLPSATSVWPSANWYEREVWDMFGITFENHPFLERLIMPLSWKGYPLRKDHPARATEMGPFQLPEGKQEAEQDALQFKPEKWKARIPTSCF
jgi:NADH-quinone oxidoreductase subunit C/D